jgi:hypothetical protein
LSRGLRACDIDGLPNVQKQAAQFMIRMPHASANVLLRRRNAFEKLKISKVRALSPDTPWVGYWLDHPVSMGGYEYPTNLNDAGLIHMYGMFCKRGLSPREAARVGRQDLLKASYDHLERSIRDLLARTLKEGGFDPASDIEAITVNRWAHDPAPLPIDVLVELERILTDAGRRRSRPRAHRQTGQRGRHDCSFCPLSESPCWQGLFRDSASPKGEDLQGLQPDASHVGGGWAAGPGRSGVWRCRPVSGGACGPKRRP